MFSIPFHQRESILSGKAFNNTTQQWVIINQIKKHVEETECVLTGDEGVGSPGCLYEAEGKVRKVEVLKIDRKPREAGEPYGAQHSCSVPASPANSRMQAFHTVTF